MTRHNLNYDTRAVLGKLGGSEPHNPGALTQRWRELTIAYHSTGIGSPTTLPQ